ncbi:MAG: carbohydrate binding domain-containing protein [Chloroflexota bacterium]|nr:carbohydrate binding domain-containing protein [Chloroflexota bacterium]
MKNNKILFHIAILLMLVVLASMSCTFAVVDPAAICTPEALTTAPATKKIALKSFHGQYVTALGAGGGWLLRQEPNLSDCAKFTLDYLDDGKVTLMTCYGRYVTAPRTGVTRSDWRLWQESELGDCGQFVLYDLGGNDIAFETCAGNFLTAGDGGWPGDLAWAVVAETDVIKDWEHFNMLRPYTPLQSMIVNFDSCTGVTKLGGQMGAAIDPLTGDRLVESYVEEGGRGCIARLEYDIANWGAFWILLQNADLSPYSQIVFDLKAGQQEVPEQVKIELKRAGGQQISILRYSLSEVTTDWQTVAVDLSDFRGSLSSFIDMEELVFTFEASGSRKTGVIYLDNIALRRE